MKSMGLRMLAMLGAFLMLVPMLTMAEPAFNEEQKKFLGQFIDEHLIKHPEVLVQASKALQRKQQEQMLARAQAAVPGHAKELFRSNSPSVGPEDAKVHVAVFFDYLCGHCREMSKVVDKLLKAHGKNLRVVFLELPIFGPTSQYVAKASLASAKQKKYHGFHQALMRAKPPLNQDKVMEVAKSEQLNTEQLKKDMQIKALDEHLGDNMVLAQALGVMGTPAFVVASHVDDKEAMKVFFVPGAADFDTLHDLINQAAS